MIIRYRSIFGAFVLAAVTSAPAVAQRGVGDEVLRAGERVTRLVASPTQLTIQAGDTVPLAVRALDAQGNEVQVAARFSKHVKLTIGFLGGRPTGRVSR